MCSELVSISTKFWGVMGKEHGKRDDESRPFVEAFREFRQLKSTDDTTARAIKSSGAGRWGGGEGKGELEMKALQALRCKRYLRGMSAGTAVSLIEIDYPESFFRKGHVSTSI